MNAETIFEIVTKVMAWITSLGTAGTFITLAILGKLTKAVIKLLILAGVIALIFWIASNPGIREIIGDLF